MTTRCSACVGLMTLLTATAGAGFAQQAVVTIEQINTVVFPAEGGAAAQAICSGLASGALTRDQVGSALARVQEAFREVGEPSEVSSYITAFNRSAAGISGCNLEVTGQGDGNLWTY